MSSSSSSSSSPSSSSTNDAPSPLPAVVLSPNPFAEPSWSAPDSAAARVSPYYKPSHFALRDYCRRYIDSLADVAPTWEERGEVPPSQWREHARLGLVAAAIQPFDKCLRQFRASGVTLPAAIPPEEWDVFHSVIASDELMRCGYLGVIWSLGGGNGIGAPPLVNFGSEQLKDEILPALFRGEKRICLGITEPQAGSDVAQIKTTAVRSQDGSHYVVNGQKKWITNGIYADYVTAAVRTGGAGASGISVLVIPLDLPGVERRKLANSGVNASGSTLLTFDDVRVPSRYLLGKENAGFPIVMSNFNAERLTLAVMSLRMARVCLADAYEYACRRKTFGKTLIEQPVIRNKFSDMGRAVERSQAWLEELANAMNRLPKRSADYELAGKIALLKVDAGRALELCVRESQQVLGGLGFQRGGSHAGARIEQVSRDVRVMVVGGGSDEIMTDLGMRMEMMKANNAGGSASKL